MAQVIYIRSDKKDEENEEIEKKATSMSDKKDEENEETIFVSAFT